MEIKSDRKIKHFIFYFKKIMKFYSLKNEYLTPVLFVIMLAVAFGTRLILIHDIQNLFSSVESLLSQFRQQPVEGSLLFLDSYKNMMLLFPKVAGILILEQVILFLLALIYLTFYLAEVKGEYYTFSKCVVLYIKSLPSIIIMNAVYYVALCLILWFGAIVFTLIGIFIPFLVFLSYIFIIVLYIIITVAFIFKDVLIIDRKAGILGSLLASFKITLGQRGIIAKNVIFIYFLQYVLTIIPVGMSNQIAALFIISFFEIIIIFIMQRLIALMYNDAVYREDKD